MTITIGATIPASTALGTAVSNQGTASFDADNNGSNETTALTDDPAVAGGADPTSFTVTSPATVTATKTVTGTFNPGGAITYTVVLTNAGPAAQADNPGNEFVDVLPASLTLVSASATSGTAVATVGTRTVTWNGSLANGASVTITISATIAASPPPAHGVQSGHRQFRCGRQRHQRVTALTDDPGVGGAADPTASSSLAGDLTGDQDGERPVLSRRRRYLHGRPVQHGTSTQADNPDDEFIDVLPASLTLVSATASSGAAVATVGTRHRHVEREPGERRHGDDHHQRDDRGVDRARHGGDESGHGQVSMRTATAATSPPRSPTIPVWPARPTRPASPSPPRRPLPGPKR